MLSFRQLLRHQLRNELDVVLAQKSARECAQLVQLPGTAATKFATAVSEICRNAVEHAGMGEVSFGVRTPQVGPPLLEALVTDRGRGISQPSQWLHSPPTPGRRGAGLYNSKRLVDELELQSSEAQGTRVVIRQRLAAAPLPKLTESHLQGWREKLQREAAISPYEELKRQNDELVQLYGELRTKNQETEQQLQVISRLNYELEKLNAANESLLREREAQNQSLQRINSQLDAFAHTVSHDLKSPLHNIMGLTYLVEEGVENNDPADIAQSLTLLRQQTDWMERLIHGILDYARAGREQLPRTRVDVGELVSRILQTLTIPAGFRVHVAPTLPVLLTEEIFLQQVLSNLLSNAIKYHDQPAQGQVWVDCQPPDGPWLQLSVTDDGPGVAPEDQPTLFEIFQVVSSRAVADSTGVGLAIVRKIVDDKGGRVWVESTGRGARFAFTWPAAEEVRAEAAPTP